MITWTNAANDELLRRLDSVRKRLRGEGDGGDVDANEVVDDLRRHVDEEFAKDQVSVVTVADVKRVLTRIGVPEQAAETSNPLRELGQAAADARGTYRQVIVKRSSKVAAVLFGVVTPLIAIALEAVNNTWGANMFNPLPTIWHVLLALTVPVANLSLVAAGPDRLARHCGKFNFLNSFAIGIALFYALMFLPFTPFAVVGILLIGLGLLPLAPLTGLIALLKGRRRYLTGREGVAGLTGRKLRPWWGLGLAGLSLVALHLPPALTHIGLQWATSTVSEDRGRGLWMLRHVGSEEMLLRACYAQRGWMQDPISELLDMEGRVSPELAREAFYRVTGKPFNSVAPPSGTFDGRRGGGGMDFAQGGDAVAGQVRGLALTESRFDGVVDGDGAWGYGEWTMVYRNADFDQHEARAQILLPAGGVVSRLTLWVNGEPCEAAFSARERVKAAYKSVVTVQRRDPVLVTTAGPDRVMVQCFPVPPNGGTMKIRMGITFPLQLAKADRGNFGLPAIIERNFAIADGMKHSVWLEGSIQLSDASGLLKSEAPKPKLFALRGDLSDRQLCGLPAVLSAARDPEVRTSWSLSPPQMKDATNVIVQRVEERAAKTPGQVVLVADVSTEMSAAVEEIAGAISSLPAGVNLSVILADDEPVLLNAQPIKVTAEAIKPLVEGLKGHACRGGHDSALALCKAWDIAATSGESVVVWVHGTQPVLLGGVEGLRQRYERRPDGVRLLMMQAVAGPNRVCESLECPGDISRFARQGSVGDDLRRLFCLWTTTEKALAVKREPATTRPSEARAKQTAPHLARLWAAEQIRTAAQSGKATPGSATAKQAIDLAGAYQLVTPLSGAVVLENRAQFAQNGLTPVDPATVPTVPEPETVMLLVISAGAVIWVIWRKRRIARVA